MPSRIDCSVLSSLLKKPPIRKISEVTKLLVAIRNISLENFVINKMINGDPKLGYVPFFGNFNCPR